MKKIIILPFLFLAIFSWGQAQFIVQNGTKTLVYTNINDALSNAASGDTLYLPGGGFTISTTTIDKTLHWVGHGHYPSETSATLPTRIATNLSFDGSCDNSSFEGILFTGSLNFGSADDETTNIQMKRCRVMGTLSLRYINTGTPDLNFQISECVLQSVNANNGNNCLIEKSLIFSYIDNFYQSLFDHNVINVDGSSTYSNAFIRYSNGCTLSNNVFGFDGGLHSTGSCTFLNNIFPTGLPYSSTNNSNSGSNNIYNVATGTAFVSITGNANVFNYDNNYQLSSSTTGTAESDGSTVNLKNTASDGTNAGIYGTTEPYKTIPYYPHINTANIATKVENNQLNVSINAEAQSR